MTLVESEFHYINKEKNDVQPSVVIHTWYLNENIMYDMMYDSCCDCFFKEKHLSI